MKKESDFRDEIILKIAMEMAAAARTAPKARGLDLLEILILEKDDIAKLSNKMKEIGERESHNTFLRDSENIKSAQALLLLGAKKKTIGLKYCSFCGFENCAECEKADAVCAYNSGDLGIAIGSAVSCASDHRIDNRVMYSAGKAAIEAKLFSADVKIAYGMPLSMSSKNPFFDRR